MKNLEKKNLGLYGVDFSHLAVQFNDISECIILLHVAIHSFLATIPIVYLLSISILYIDYI